MSTTIRFFRRASIAAAGLVGVTVVSSTAADAAVPDEPRSVLFINVDSCPESATSVGRISVSYDDLVDGHRPVGVIERLADQSGQLWSSTELNQVDGDYFNDHEFEWPTEIPLTSSSVFTYSLSITYDDGVTEDQSVRLAIADQCATGSPPTTAPPTSAPAAPRFELSKTAARCSGGLQSASIEFLFVDTVDQHVGVEHFYQLTAGGRVVGEIGGESTSATDGLKDRWTEPNGIFDLDRLEATTYTLTVWIKYEDGVVVSDSAAYDVAALCDGDPASTPPASSPTTAPPAATRPSGQLPQTGSSTGIVVALGVLLSTAGAIIVLGSRRRPAA
jgi:LPXTG-motif cell wall-anchored protein